MSIQKRMLPLGIPIIIIATVLAAYFGGPGDNLRAESAQISVIEIVNQVEVQRPGNSGLLEAAFGPAYVGQELWPGDLVITNKSSEARVDITIREFTRITRTMPNTVWRLGSFAEDKGAVIELDQGTIFLFDNGDGRQQNWHINVVTPAGNAAPRGTWLSVSHDPETGITEVQCFRGECELENELGKVILKEEQKSNLSATRVPEIPVILDDEDKSRFFALPEVETGEMEVPAQLDDAPGILLPVVRLAPAQLMDSGGPGVARAPISPIVVMPNQGSGGRPQDGDANLGPVAVQDFGPLEKPIEQLVSGNGLANDVVGGGGYDEEEPTWFVAAPGRSGQMAADEDSQDNRSEHQGTSDASVSLGKAPSAGLATKAENNRRKQKEQHEPTGALANSGKGRATSEDQEGNNGNSGRSGGNGQDKARNDEAWGPDVASANGSSDRSDGNGQDQARNDEAWGHWEGGVSLQVSTNGNSGRSVSNGQANARNDETGGLGEGGVALQVSANGNSGRDSKSVKVSNKPDDQAGSAGSIEISLLQKLGFAKPEAITLVDQGQADRVIEAIAKKVAKEVSKLDKTRDGRVFVEDHQEDPLDSASIVSLWIDTMNSRSGDTSSADGDSSATVDKSEISTVVDKLVVKTETSTVVDKSETSTVVVETETSPVVVETETSTVVDETETSTVVDTPEPDPVMDTPAPDPVVVEPVNTAPVAVDDTASGAENANKINIDVLQNDSDADGDSLDVTNLTQPSNGSVTLKNNSTVDYKPDPSFFGVDTFTYTANDGTDDSNVATVTVTVTEVITPPVAVDDTASGVENVNKINIDVLQNDSDPNGDPLAVTNLTQPSNGSVSLKNNNTVDYTPDPSFFGVDTFTYTANDGTDDSNVATVTVTVTANTAPVAVDDTASTVKKQEIAIAILQNDSDADGDSLTVTNLTQPSNGTVTLNPDNTVVYDPNPGFTGVDTFTYTAKDGAAKSNVATVTITVT